jgi:ribonuclease E
MRDLFTADTDEIIIDSEEVCRRVREFLGIVSPAMQSRVKVYRGKVPIFTKFRIEESVNQLYERRIELPHGGSIIIEQTEALVAIDVNSGKYTEESDAETTAFRTNMEAAPEIARQLRLRDLGGVVVMDFIDMRQEKHRREVEKALFNAMKRDRARKKILRTSQFGLVQMTRQRMRPSVARAVFERCPTCGGTGHVRTIESVTLLMMRELRKAIPRKDVDRLEVTLYPDVAMKVLNAKREELLHLERKWQKPVTVRGDRNVNPQEVEIVGFKGKKPVKL